MSFLCISVRMCGLACGRGPWVSVRALSLLLCLRMCVRVGVHLFVGWSVCPSISLCLCLGRCLCHYLCLCLCLCPYLSQSVSVCLSLNVYYVFVVKLRISAREWCNVTQTSSSTTLLIQLFKTASSHGENIQQQHCHAWTSKHDLFDAPFYENASICCPKTSGP